MNDITTKCRRCQTERSDPILVALQKDWNFTTAEMRLHDWDAVVEAAQQLLVEAAELLSSRPRNNDIQVLEAHIRDNKNDAFYYQRNTIIKDGLELTSNNIRHQDQEAEDQYWRLRKMFLHVMLKIVKRLRSQRAHFDMIRDFSLSASLDGIPGYEAPDDETFHD